MHAVYTNKIQKKEINLYVIDWAKNPEDLEMVDFAYAMENRGKDKKDIKPYVTQYNERKKVKFTGRITAVKNDCWSDGTCSIEVDNKWWIGIQFGLGDPSLRKKERGLAKGIRFTRDNESIGKRVKVYAEVKNDHKLTLEGSKAYYVEVVVP